MKKSFPFEFEKYLAGTAYLSHKEKGCYVDLLCYEADKGHMTLQDIKDILNGDYDCWQRISNKFAEENGLYYNKKLESVKHKKTVEEIVKDKLKVEQELKDKRQKFYEDCKPYLQKYPKVMLREFYNYWTEMNKSETKLKFELQQTFEISKRLATWARNDKDFNKSESCVTLTYEEILKLAEKEPDIWKKYKAIKRDGERKATFILIKT